MPAIILYGFGFCLVLATAATTVLWLQTRDRLTRLSAELGLAEARTRMAESRALAAEDKAASDREARESMANFLAAQSARATQDAIETLAKRNEEQQLGRDQLVQARLDAQLKPVSEALSRFQEQVTAVEKARAEETGGLKTQIAALMTASIETQQEARKLGAALRRGAGVQGRWGEQMLRNTLELAGLRAGTDFIEQFSVKTSSGTARPDVVVRLPGGGQFVIDAKVSLNAFLEAQDALTDDLRDAASLRHAQSVRSHFHDLAAKAYWDQLESSPDFVAMFVPGDGFLAAALDRLPELMSEAMEKRVILVTPTTLFALCKAVAYGWRVESQAVNAREVAELGRELYKRLSVMGDHVAGVGRALGDAVGRYNKFVGSLESQVLTQARRFEALQVHHEGKPLAEIGAIESAPRALSKLTAQDPDLTLEGPPPTSLPS